MSFDSIHFLFFFAFVLVASWVLRDRIRARNGLLLIASYYFYGCWDWRFLSLIVLSTAVDYTCGLVLHNLNVEASEDPTRTVRQKKLVLLISLVTNLGLLGIFKYFNFFADSAADLLTMVGLNIHPTTLRIVLPVGISFYTFQTLSYTIDLYRNKIEVEKDPLNFALYVAFFPQLVAGPIERASNLLPQMSRRHHVTAERFGSGLYLVFWGLFKKIAIADNVATFANMAFSGEPHSGLFSLLGIYAFAIQIYCDFSGYSDIARGAARCLGFDIMLNFNLPYFATNPSEFWQRWHISLSSWLRDYLYIPLGGNRVSRNRNYFNLMATMVLGGLWHGASWVFVIWGTYQGILLCAHRLFLPFFEWLRPSGQGWTAKAWHFFSVVFFFQLTCLGWLIFRAQNTKQIMAMIADIFTNFPGPIPGWVNFGHLATLATSAVFLLLIQFYQYRTRDLNVLFRLPALVQGGFMAACLLAIVIFGRIHGNAFIYFQF